MTIQEVINKFLESPKRMDMGAGKLSKRWKCEKQDIYDARKEVRKVLKKNKPNSDKLPKILIFDIEISATEAAVWGLWKQNIYQEQIISPWFMLTWSAKWLFSDEVLSARLTSKEAKNENDKRIVKELWDLLDEADVVVAHNGDNFDVPRMNVRFLVNDLPPTSLYQKIDTLKIARKEFAFLSNKLDSLASTLGLEGKVKTEFELWRRCRRGEESALIEMENYNKQDVVLLEEVYLELRPWIKSHPSVALFLEEDKHICPSCGHDHLTKKGTYRTQVSVFDTYQCNSCSAISRSRENKVPKELRKNLLVSVSR
jgi:DNA polymerase elongation subunit (family B)/predicted RNA-binding Zn-ribbon protein involved in translation (DUF1610 family)